MNPVKTDAAKGAFLKMFPNEEIEFVQASIDSGVSDQPMSNEETKRGALNRATNAKLSVPDADYWVGQEGGLIDEGDCLRSVPWMCIINKAGKISTEHAASFTILPEIEKLVRDGMELSDASDIYFKTESIGKKGGSIALMTNGAIDRAHYYEQALITALIPFSITKPGFYVSAEPGIIK